MIHGFASGPCGNKVRLLKYSPGDTSALASIPDKAFARYLLLLGNRDEVLDRRETEAFFADFGVLVRADGHRFEGLHACLSLIADVFGLGQSLTAADRNAGRRS